MADSSSVGTSSSSSTPTVTETNENAILDQLSGYASNLAGQMYSWAQGVYAQTSQITNEAVGNFLQASQSETGLAGNMISQYNNLFAPENAQLVQDANSYASPERMAVDMGMAGATQAQSGDQAIKNSEQNLLSYGIDPSSGRYAALDKASAVQNAANVAGAENTQRQSDISTGQKLRSEAVTVGSQLPAAISNAENTAIQANTAASNAALSNANTGANLYSLPDKYLSTAMNLKLPLSGQTSSSQSQNSGRSSSPNPSSGNGNDKGGGQGSGNGNGQGGGQGYRMPDNTSAMGIDGGGGGRGQPGSEIIGVKGGGGGGSDQIDWGNALGGQSINPETGLANSLDGTDFNQWTNGGFSGDNVTSGLGDIGGQSTDAVSGLDGSNVFSQGMGDIYGDTTGNTFGNLGNDNLDTTGLGNLTYDPSANQANLPEGWTDPPTQTGSSDVFNGADTSGNDVWNTGSGTDYTSADTGGGDLGYAQGGPIPMKASPSGGRRVDDVPAQMPSGQRAQLNAGEFVVPNDVAAWKGHEFFHNMIAQSRAKRAKMQAMMPVGPKAMPMRGQHA